MLNRSPTQGVPDYRCTVWLVLLSLWLSGCAASSHQDEALADSITEVAEQIQANYEAVLLTLPPAKQRHYAQRLYRLSGDAHYVPLAESHAEGLILQLDKDVQGLATPGYPQARSQALVVDYPTRTPKQRARRQLLAEWGEIIYARSLLFRLIQLDYYGLLDTPRLNGHKRALAYLAEVDFQTFLTDPEVLSTYAAQVANISHFLYQLGVVDLRDEAIAAFRDHYPPSRVAALDTEEYRNWLYGLTHFVIADSRYYQRLVSAEEHDWVLEAFDREFERIVRDATEDIIAEVGISILLAGGTTDHPGVERLRQALVAAYDPHARMIPATDGTTDLARGEHRNVLAIMLLRWPERLHPGPDLRDTHGTVTPPVW